MCKLCSAYKHIIECMTLQTFVYDIIRIKLLLLGVQISVSFSTLHGSEFYFKFILVFLRDL